MTDGPVPAGLVAKEPKARLAPDGGLTQPAAKNDGLMYPTMPAFGTTPTTRTALHITNGASYNGTPDIAAFDAGVRGLPLP